MSKRSREPWTGAQVVLLTIVLLCVSPIALGVIYFLGRLLFVSIG